MYQWASEPCRFPLTAVPRNPGPIRALLKAPKATRRISEEALATLLAVSSKKFLLIEDQGVITP